MADRQGDLEARDGRAESDSASRLVQLRTGDLTEEIRLVASYKGIQKNLLWISLQDDGAVSIGFLGQPLVFAASRVSVNLKMEFENLAVWTCGQLIPPLR